MGKMMLSNIHFFIETKMSNLICVHELIRNALFKKHITKTYSKKMKPK